MDDVNPLLVRKYYYPLFNYNDYPATLCLNNKLSLQGWISNFTNRFAEQNHINGISICIQFPSVESLPGYSEQEYLLALEKEWVTYRKLMKQTPVVRELYLKADSPSLFSPGSLKRLAGFLLKSSVVHPRHEFSIEADGRTVSLAQLKILHAIGFKRISYSIRHNDSFLPLSDKVSYKNLRFAIEEARRIGFTSVNCILSYEEPMQTVDRFEETLQGLLELRPDCISFRNYFISPPNDSTRETNFPETKIELYLKGKELLGKGGYCDVGLDYFVMPGNELLKAKDNGKLCRNLMGYSVQNTAMVLGLGVSAISDTGTAIAQNKRSEDYYTSVWASEPSVDTGCLLNAGNIALKKYINAISCNGESVFKEEDLPLLENYIFPKLKPLSADRLVEWNHTGIKLTNQGRHFIAAVCSAFELPNNTYFQPKETFSEAIDKSINLSTD